MTDSQSEKKIKNKKEYCLIVCLLVLLPLAAYWQITSQEFLYFDDDAYVTQNTYVKTGLSLKNIIWAFGISIKTAYWHPLTWMSHMLDCQLFGLNPGMHHLSSLILHIANTLLLFFVFNLFTNTLWKSAFVAALFALHPVNVDSVAWLAERKNLLSTFFWLLTMLSYFYYAKKPAIFRYVLTLTAFALGLLSKPMLVTLPCALLLFDYWPLKRIRLFEITSFYRPVIEKIPFFVMAGIVTFLAHKSLLAHNKVITTAMVPMKLRIENAIVSYISYMGKMIWPHNLAIIYPFPDTVPIWKTVSAGLFLILVSFFVIKAVKQKPYLAVGWFWFLGTLVPVIGIVQAGLWPAMADRWAYVPFIGLFVMVVWGACDFFSTWRCKNSVLAPGSVIIILLLTGATWHQAGYWTNQITLFKHTLEVTTNNPAGHFSLGFVLQEKGRTAEATEHYKETIRIFPRYVQAHVKLGSVLIQEGKTAEAVDHLYNTLRLFPDHVGVLNDLGRALALDGKASEAIQHFNKALSIEPDSVEAHYNLGITLDKKGEIAKAIKHFQEALRINPDDFETHNNLGIALIKEGNISDAISHYARALLIKPDAVSALVNMANALFAKGDMDKAIDHYNEALSIDPDSAQIHNNLGSVLLTKGNIDEAVGHFHKALQIEPDLASARENLKKALKNRSEKYNKIIDSIKKELESDPENYRLFFKLGNAYKNMGNIDDAEKSYKQALLIQPEYIPAINNLGLVHIQRKEDDKALFLFKKIIEIQPDSVMAYYNLACISSKQNNIEAAVQWLQKAVENGFNHWNSLKTDNDLKNIRSTSYYQKLESEH